MQKINLFISNLFIYLKRYKNKLKGEKNAFPPHARHQRPRSQPPLLRRRSRHAGRAARNQTGIGWPNPLPVDARRHQSDGGAAARWAAVHALQRLYAGAKSPV